MAMDKENLMQRLQTQYLTRQEVLFKLPLNISINSFWPELIERRKLSSVVLPLHRADGKPLWYVLTDRMIAASEKLCALALDCTAVSDPFRSTLTCAMTEELFFTSFVEGAQITLQQAMAFLERGTEPENVQEQMIQNNRQAWSEMIGMLYYPLDEHCVRLLAYRLTEEMDGQAADYRQTDAHPIEAMGKEAYDVPPASALPGLMREYYDFLANAEVHPLIKAAVGQAYILVTRPFPEGNERLARMISYAVLLRCGYDFLRDISISGMIARESYRYFKSMQDIIRSENGGDLTYFIEYFLDLLARSIDAKAELDRRRQEEALLMERQMAAKPLTRAEDSPATEKPLSAEAVPGNEPPHQPAENRTDEGAADEQAEPDPDSGDEFESQPNESPPREFSSPDEYLRFLQEARANGMKRTQEKRANRITAMLTELVERGTYSFLRGDWDRMTRDSKSITRDDLALMLKLGLITCEQANDPRCLLAFRIPIAEHADEGTGVSNEKAIQMQAQNDLRNAIQTMLASAYTKERQVAAGLLKMLDSERKVFTFSEWMEMNQEANKDVGSVHLRMAVNYGFLEFDGGVYRFASMLSKGPQCHHIPDKQREVLLKLMEAFPTERFSARDAAIQIGMKPCSIGYYLDSFTHRGILKMTKARQNTNCYEFSTEVHGIFEAIESAEESARFQQMPEREKEIHDPLRGMAEAG